MSYSWILESSYKEGIDPIDSGIVTINSVEKYDALSNLYDSNIDTPFRTCGDSTNSLNITFNKKKYLITSYKIESNINLRFLKGWNIIASTDLKNYTVIVSQNENFCTSIISSTNDCGTITKRAFAVQPTILKFISLRMTTSDSYSNSFCIHISSFDVFGKEITFHDTKFENNQICLPFRLLTFLYILNL